MKQRHYLISATMLLSLILISSSAYAARSSWEMWVNANQYDYSPFQVESDNLLIKLRVRVFEGGPVSVFVLDETTYLSWVGGSIVTAYLGGENITHSTLEGYLGLSQYNNSDNYVEYRIVVDNRANSYGSNVLCEIVSTLPAPSAFIALLSLIPLALIVIRKRKRPSD